MNFIQGLLKKKGLLIALAIILVIGGYYTYKNSNKTTAATTYITSSVVKGTLTVSVTGTGQVASSNQVDIKPEASGQIVSVPVVEGQSVKAGQTIATLDAAAASTQLAGARASLLQAQANYDKVAAGTATNDIASAQLAVNSAQQALDDAKKNYDQTVTQQQQIVDKAHSDLLNTDLQAQPSDTLSTITLTLSGNYNSTQQGQYIISTYQGGDGLHYSVTGLSTQNGLINKGLTQPLGNGLYVTFSTTGTLSQSTTWTIDVPNTKSSNYITNQNAYNTALGTQTKSVNSAQSAINSAEISLQQAQLTLSSKTQPPAQADLAQAQAQIASARAALANAETAYNNTVIKAPFDGVIAKLSAVKGDQASSGTAVATIITQQKIAEISLNEVDASKIKPGQKATLTFSALPDLSVAGEVGQVDTIGTVSQNVVNFSAKILLDTQDDRIKPGMSVSAAVITDVAQDVLSVPSAAVKTSNGQSYVQVMVNGKPQQRNITPGLSNDTDTQISGDIKEGDIVVARNNEFTLKYLQQEKGKPCLVPANKKYPTIYPENSLTIEGL